MKPFSCNPWQPFSYFFVLYREKSQLWLLHTFDKNGKSLEFTAEAIKEIYQANRGVDLQPGSDLQTSEDFDIPENQFDNKLWLSI